MAGFLAAAAPAPQVGDLGWLAGAWVSENDEGWVEEQWTDARGGTMLGTNRSGKGEKATGYEYMRIAADDRGAIQFWGSPSGAPPVAFPLVSIKDREATFENPAHDYPTRIVYRLEKDVLVGTVSGPEGKNPLSWTFKRPSVR
ncbi:MAG: hypothetical protein H0W74_05730 [Sphingosinicella sp.]|nr:hypothetical protein [Sphingosinicella sp.]